MQENLIFTTNPGVALRVLQMPYEFTGVIDRTWIEACKIVGRNYTSREMDMGWPCAMEPHRLACMQAPNDPTGQTYIYTAMEGGCRLGRVPCEPFERRDYEILKNGERKLVEVWIDYAITPQTFFSWLKNQNEQPSRFIDAWFKANGVHWEKPKAPEPAPSTAPPVATPEAVPVAPATTGLTADDVKDFETLVRYRLQFKDLQAQQRPEWKIEHIALIEAAINERGRGGKASVARELVIHTKTLGDMLKKLPKPKANVFSALGERRKAV